MNKPIEPAAVGPGDRHLVLQVGEIQDSGRTRHVRPICGRQIGVLLQSEILRRNSPGNNFVSLRRADAQFRLRGDLPGVNLAGGIAKFIIRHRRQFAAIRRGSEGKPVLPRHGRYCPGCSGIQRSAYRAGITGVGIIAHCCQLGSVGGRSDILPQGNWRTGR